MMVKSHNLVPWSIIIAKERHVTNFLDRNNGIRGKKKWEGILGQTINDK